jgi:putative N6-adenine-specific DNA methylase
MWQQLQTAARTQQREPQGLIAASDLLGRELDHARANLEAAGLLPWVALKQANVLELPPPAAGGVMLCNPPYGERLGESDELAAFYPKLGDALKKRWAGWRCYFLTGDPRLPKLIGLKASRRTPLFNGAIDCRLLEFRMVAGSMRDKASG